MAEQEQTVEYVSVRDEDIIAERRGMYQAFTAAIPYSIGVVAFILAFLWLFWG